MSELQRIARGHWSLAVRQAEADQCSAPQADEGTLQDAVDAADIEAGEADYDGSSGEAVRG